MPLRRDEGYIVHVAPDHPFIYEQKGHFFWPDGCEIPFETVAKILDYNLDFCRRYGVKFNEAKHRRVWTIEELKKMRRPEE